ncbi:MAG: hypothetical protein B6229_09950 [Spirochaetaceae bacterium 4572_7]|nr:MAG: hypothetical protein B6229_09950 [Spirochaetaceae bacterium 4572_7]
MIVKNTTTDLLYPYGITSLSEDDPYFHPFHENPKYYHKDAAYHNGTIWGWNAGLIVTGLNKFGYQDLAYKLTKNLSNQILTMGAIGSMSENLSAFPDKNGDPILSGTFSQAWSVSEFARNGYQDYLGFRPSLLENSLKISPSFPTSWNKIKAELPFGDSESITIVGNKNNNIWEFSILLNSSTSRDINWSGIDNLGVRREYTFKTEPYSTQMLIWNFKEEIGDLNFRTPNVNKSFPSTSNRDVLKGIILNKEYK